MTDIDVNLARRMIRTWMNQERPYAESKWPTEDEVVDGETSFEWVEWIDQYMKRATTLGLDTEKGRVALAKAVMTATRILEHAVMEHGPLPRGGVPS